MRDREPDGRLRVFVSSTMDDLVNEREAVCRRLRELNFEPVNAENWLPSGDSSWPRIQGKIRSSDLCVLLLGERYGWIPKDGPASGSAKSVTQLEFDEARELGLTVLPFAKELKYSSESRSEDATKRDSFRKEVFDWAQYFRGREFRNCFELAEMVGASVVELISTHFQRTQIEARTAQRQDGPDQEIAPPATPIALPSELIESVRSGTAMMLAGAGISLAAGLPSASAFATRLAQAATAVETNRTNIVGGSFIDIATEIDLVHGRAFLVDAIKPLLRPPQGVSPTLAHRAALRLFRTIVTTNYDDLFERAAEGIADARPIIENELAGGRLPEPVLIKFHGSFNRPETLVLSERDVFSLDRARPALWQSVVELLRQRRLVVIGSSLHDGSLVRLCLDAGDALGGWLVAPNVSPAAARRLAAWRLQTIDATADVFLGALMTEIATTAVRN